MHSPLLFALCVVLGTLLGADSTNKNSVGVKTHPDQVLELPGLNYEPNFRHYSGYVVGGNNAYIHYWFVESQKKPKDDPVLIWLHGDLGCSSLDELLSGLGPFRINPDGKTLRENVYAWNKATSILFLEFPAGVGFSVSLDGNVTANDDSAALGYYIALQDFFLNKFPEYAKNDLYIAGQSYAGVIIPKLALLVEEGAARLPLNFKGIAIGNGMLNEKMNINNLFKFAYSHGFVNEELYRAIKKGCCDGCFDTCDLLNQAGKCKQMVREMLNPISENGLNLNDLYSDCDYPGETAKIYPRDWFDTKSKFPLFWQQFSIMENRETQQTVVPQQQTQARQVYCRNMTAIHMYLNQKSVRKALNIQDDAGRWLVCSDHVLKAYGQIHKDMTKHIMKLLENYKIRMLFYYGDTDMTNNVIAGKRFAASLKQKLLRDSRPWYYKKQIAGFVTRYDKVDFLTVKGCGQMVSMRKPAQALKMITDFIYRQLV